MKLQDAARAIRRLGTRIVGAIQKAERRSARVLLRKLKKLSSGTKSQADLNQADNPFARRHGKPLFAPEVINKQSGVFRDSWQMKDNPHVASVAPFIENTASYAPFLEKGTKKMFARPIDVAAMLAIEPVREENLDREIKQLERDFNG